MSKELVGCCGAYCATCRVMKQNACKGCKTGYTSAERDISKARCRIKICCIQKGFYSCADCSGYSKCGIIGEFHAKKGYKYGKYREAIEFIIANGYEDFFIIADKWSMQYGKYR